MKSTVEASLTLVTDYEGENPKGWWITEKLDGCRLRWDGFRLWSRGGLVVPAPSWATADLPAGVALDLEAWAGRGKLQVARVAVQHNRWDPSVRLVAFDCPHAPGDWQERMQAVPERLRLEYARCTGRRSLQREFARVVRLGGEGLVIRAPGVGYVKGRSRATLRIVSPHLI